VRRTIERRTGLLERCDEVDTTILDNTPEDAEEAREISAVTCDFKSVANHYRYPSADARRRRGSVLASEWPAFENANLRVTVFEAGLPRGADPSELTRVAEAIRADCGCGEVVPPER
jgi:hypothetical protein